MSSSANYILPPADPCTLVIFGASGDLTKRLLLPSLGNLRERALLADDFTVVGFARSPTAPDVGDLPRFTYVSGDFDDESSWDRLGAALGPTRFRSSW